MKSQPTNLETPVICAPDRFPEIETLMRDAGSSTVVHLDTSLPLPTQSGSGTLVIGPGIDRARQIELIFLQRDSTHDTLLISPEFQHLNNALGKRIGDSKIVPISGASTRSIEFMVQRIFDLVIALIAILLILIPMTLILGPIILLTSRGGVFFSTTVVGENGRRFTWRKFRSMRPPKPGDDEARREVVSRAIKHGETYSENPSTKVVDADRVTAIGKWMRKTSLDELPQLLNVVHGSMSLVGPRPCLPYEYEEYNGWQRKRLSFKPGITGVWQVYGRSRVNFDEMVFMDVCGRLNRSFFGDLKLLILTVPVALFGRGAE
jgi:lipopolysaccharide/colanic/teichoic acid biosynthesis glycosyltransferase